MVDFADVGTTCIHISALPVASRDLDVEKLSSQRSSSGSGTGTRTSFSAKLKITVSIIVVANIK